MTYAQNEKGLGAYGGYNPPKSNMFAKQRGTLKRIANVIFDAMTAILDAMYETRRRQAEREIANFIERQGGHLTDALEREIMRRLLSSSNWSPRG